MSRDHFKVVYDRAASDVEVTAQPGTAIYEWALARYGPDKVLQKVTHKAGGTVEFPVLEPGGSIASSLSRSETLRNLPPNSVDLVFLHPDHVDDARRQLRTRRLRILEEFGERELEEEDAEASTEGTLAGGQQTNAEPTVEEKK